MIDLIWNETMKLRIVRRPRKDLPGKYHVIQQAWRNVSSGDLEWRDVEIVDADD